MGPLTLLIEHAAIVGGVLLAAMAVILVLTQRRSPQSAAAWLVSIVLVPYLAVPVFLVLGFRKQGSRFASIRFTDAGPGTAQGAGPVAEALRCLGAPAAAGGNELTLHAGPEEAEAALHGLVTGTTRRLDVLFYILAADDSGRRFVRALTESARAGVRVRVLLDRVGTLTRPRKELAELQAAGGKVLYFSPFLHPPDHGHMNLRNHRKLVLADDARAWSGGRNVGDPYFAPDAWVDLSFTVAGPAVQGFCDIFATNWAIAAGTEPEPARADRTDAGTATLQVVATGPDEPGDALHTGLVQAIHAARDRVWIATPYYVPTEFLSQAVVTAARRGVDVRVMVPARSNKRMTDLARGAYLRDLARHGGRVLQLPPPMLHAKMGVIDGSAWVGTANFDVRSMLLNFETVLFAHDPVSVDALASWFETTAARAEAGVPRVGWARRILEGLFRLGSPIL